MSPGSSKCSSAKLNLKQFPHLLLPCLPRAANGNAVPCSFSRKKSQVFFSYHCNSWFSFCSSKASCPLPSSCVSFWCTLWVWPWPLPSILCALAEPQLWMFLCIKASVMFMVWRLWEPGPLSMPCVPSLVIRALIPFTRSLCSESLNLSKAAPHYSGA